jgi:hypothetical protein
MMAFLEASMLEVYGTRMIVIFWPLTRKVFYLPDTRFKKNGKFYKHLNTGIFTILAKLRRYNIMVPHIKRMTVVKRSACEKQFLTAHMTKL